MICQDYECTNFTSVYLDDGLSSNLYCKDSHYRGEFLSMCASMSVNLHAYISVQFPLDGFPRNLILRTSVQSVKILKIWFKIGKKLLSILCEDLSMFCCCCRHKFTIKTFL